MNGVITAIWWKTAEFKRNRVADAELNVNTKGEMHRGRGWGTVLYNHTEARKIPENESCFLWTDTVSQYW